MSLITDLKNINQNYLLSTKNTQKLKDTEENLKEYQEDIDDLLWWIERLNGREPNDVDFTLECMVQLKISFMNVERHFSDIRDLIDEESSFLLNKVRPE